MRQGAVIRAVPALRARPRPRPSPMPYPCRAMPALQLVALAALQLLRSATGPVPGPWRGYAPRAPVREPQSRGQALLGQSCATSAAPCSWRGRGVARNTSQGKNIADMPGDVTLFLTCPFLRFYTGHSLNTTVTLRVRQSTGRESERSRAGVSARPGDGSGRGQTQGRPRVRFHIWK